MTAKALITISSFLVLACTLSGCGTVTEPAAVRTSDGTLLLGSTSASLTGGGIFTATSADGLECNGSYDAFDTARVISAPLSCSDGRTGILTVTRTPELTAGVGNLTLNDGTTATVAFGNLVGQIVAPIERTPLDQTLEARFLSLPGAAPPAQTTSRPSTLYSPAPTTTAARLSRTPIRAAYRGRCDCPYDRMRNGRRCGGNSAYSRPGGRSPICYVP